MFKDREVLQVDAVEWLRSSDELFEGGIFTGIPDISDIPELAQIEDAREKSAQYIDWFKDVVGHIFRRLADGQYAVFSQTDAKIIDSRGCLISWVDKSHLCSTAASLHGCSLMWHKIALNTEVTAASDAPQGLDPAYVSQFRPAYTHLLCYGKNISSPFRIGQFRTPDVIARGAMTWQKATGMEACVLGVAFLLNVARCSVLLNPFCGHGTILAVANYFRLRAIGLEILPSRAKQARSKDCALYLDAMSSSQLLQLGITTENLAQSNRTSTITSPCTSIPASVSTVNLQSAVVVKTDKSAKVAMRLAMREQAKVLGRSPTPETVDAMIEAHQWTKCCRYDPFKLRLCAQKRVSGSRFCGHHQLPAAYAQENVSDGGSENIV